MFLCCVKCGLRIGEAIGARVNQFLFDQGVFVVDGFYKHNQLVRTTYNKCGSEEDRKIRVAPLPDDFAWMIQKYIAENNFTADDYVFQRYNKPIRKWLAEEWFCRAVAGETVQKIAGHTSLAMGIYMSVLNSLGLEKDMLLVAKDDELGRKVQEMTALGKIDGNNTLDGTSYLDIVQCIQQQGSKPKEDLIELWKRIVFSIAVTNTDDHLRNHGFLFDQKGLRLSPMYDVNPNPDGVGLSLNIDDMDNSLSFEVAIEAAKYFDIKKDSAAKIADDIKQNIKQWEAVAEKVGISRSNMMRMENCFKV